MIRDALHNLSIKENGNDFEHGRGVLTGVISTVMEVKRLGFESAVSSIIFFLPQRVYYKRVPPSWVQTFMKLGVKLYDKAGNEYTSNSFTSEHGS